MGFYSGIIDQNIEPAKVLNRGGNKFPHLGSHREIGLNDQATAASCLNFIECLLCSTRGTVIINHHISPLLGETNGDGTTDTQAATSHECNFSCEFHRILLILYFVTVVTITPHRFFTVLSRSSRSPSVFSVQVLHVN